MDKEKCPHCGGKCEPVDQDSIGAEMRRLRVMLNKPMKTQANDMHVSISYLSHLELGRRDWSPALVLRFKAALSE